MCLEDWSPEMQEAGDHKARWYDQTRDEGLRVKLAVDRVVLEASAVAEPGGIAMTFLDARYESCHVQP